MKSNKIKDELAYFKKVTKNMDNKEFEKVKIKEKTGFSEENTLPFEIENMCFIEDNHFCTNLLDWIEMVENADLHNALKSLTLGEKTLLSYIYYKEKTQSEVAKIYNLNQSNISRIFTNILDKIREKLLKREKI